MPGPFDITVKYLVQTYPRAWLHLLGHVAPGAVDILDSNLASVVAEADKVVRVDAPAPYLVHLEFQASSDAHMGRRLARYNLLLAHQHDLPVLSVLVLLRREADGPTMRGEWESVTPTGEGRVVFHYPVVRVWTERVERFLEGPLGLVPLAPLADVAPQDLPAVVRSVTDRIGAEADLAQAQTLDVVTFTLMGLRYPRELVLQLVPGVRTMRESSTYQFILDEGRAEGRAEGEERGRAEGEERGRAEGEARGRAVEARSLLLLMGTTKFGAPDAATRVALENIVDIERLERMG
ncbi:MAG: hypothetical protein ACKVVP_20005, partial [Chloroflexota bacterium]